MKPITIALLALTSSACSSYWQVNRLEEKVDKLLMNTRRETLTEIFGEQTGALTSKIDELDEGQRAKLDGLLESYNGGASDLEQVRSSVLGVLGGTDRIVSSAQGIWVRNEEGNKRRTISRNAKLVSCRRLTEEELPDAITSRRGLMKYTWGVAEHKGEAVLFPWELTMSSFTKEIVENTAKRTAREFLRMSGDKGWSRPVYIQVTTKEPGGLTVTHPGADEIYVLPAKEGEAEAEAAPE